MDQKRDMCFLENRRARMKERSKQRSRRFLVLCMLTDVAFDSDRINLWADASIPHVGFFLPPWSRRVWTRDGETKSMIDVSYVTISPYMTSSMHMGVNYCRVGPRLPRLEKKKFSFIDKGNSWNIFTSTLGKKEVTSCIRSLKLSIRYHANLLPSLE